MANSGEGNGNPVQYSCLENPMDRENWRAIVHGVARVGNDSVTKSPPPPWLKRDSLMSQLVKKLPAIQEMLETLVNPLEKEMATQSSTFA